jgi:hypothetical protein
VSDAATTDLSTKLVRTTRPLRSELIEAVKKLQPNQRLMITQTVRVGNKEWTAVISGRFRELKCLVTGLATHRVPRDEIIVPTIHFTKDNGELSSVTLDEHTLLEILPD